MPSQDSQKKKPRKNASIITRRKKRLVNVYSASNINKDWNKMFQRLEDGLSFNTVANLPENAVPSSTLKTKYWKWKKDPLKGGNDSR
jgi:hypothetical protein